MVWKAIRAGVPIFAAKAVPTSEAVTLAEQYGLTLICEVRTGHMKLFSGTLPQETFPASHVF